MRRLKAWWRSWFTLGAWVQPDPREAAGARPVLPARRPRYWHHDPSYLEVWREGDPVPLALVGDTETGLFMAAGRGPGRYEVRTQDGEVVEEVTVERVPVVAPAAEGLPWWAAPSVN